MSAPSANPAPTRPSETAKALPSSPLRATSAPACSTVQGELSLSGGSAPAELAICHAATSTTGLIQRRSDGSRRCARFGAAVSARGSTPVVEIDTDFSRVGFSVQGKKISGGTDRPRSPAAGGRRAGGTRGGRRASCPRASIPGRVKSMSCRTALTHWNPRGGVRGLFAGRAPGCPGCGTGFPVRCRTSGVPDGCAAAPSRRGD